MEQKLNNKRITERERAAVEWYVMSGKKDKITAYKIAFPGSLQEVNGFSSLPQVANRWMQTAKISEYLDAFKKIWEGQQTEVRERIRKEVEKELEQAGGVSERRNNEHEKSGRGFVDYSNPANQRHKLNELVNEAKDAGEALDALKIIIAGQRDDRQAAKDAQIQRFYTPETCRNCEIKTLFRDIREAGNLEKLAKLKKR